MPWIRIDDHYDEHPKFARAGPLGVAMWLAGLAYCNRNLTDGFIPWSVARSLISWEFLRPAEHDPERELIWTVGMATGMHGEDVGCPVVIDLLVDAGLWEEVAGGYRIHDYGDYQPTKSQVLAERATKAAAGRAGGLATAAARATATGEAGAVAESQPVPVPVPVSGPQNRTESDARESLPAYDGRADLEAFLLVKRRPPTARQRQLLDGCLLIHDLTGPQWAADIILAHPDDPIGAVIAADKAYRQERIDAAKAQEHPVPIRRRKGSGLTGINAELAEAFADFEAKRGETA